MTPIIKPTHIATFFETPNEPLSAWQSTLINTVNGNNVRLRKMHKMQAKWHQHEHSDEMFLVLEGSLSMETEHETYRLNKGDIFVVPRQTKHRSIVDKFAYLMIIDNI